MKVAIIDENRARAALVEEGLRASGVRDVLLIESTGYLLHNILAFDPDVVIVDLDDPNRDTLEQMFAISRVVQRPVAMFVDRAAEGDVERAVEAGVSAYVVDGLTPARVRPVIDAAVTRYRAFANLQRELTETRNALAERRHVEQAKALLMARRDLAEEDAYRLLRERAMKERRRIGEVARALLDADRMLGGNETPATDGAPS